MAHLKYLNEMANGYLYEYELFINNMKKAAMKMDSFSAIPSNNKTTFQLLFDNIFSELEPKIGDYTTTTTIVNWDNKKDFFNIETMNQLYNDV